MSFVPLDLESLANIDDGQVGLLVRRQLQQACRDCVDRPTDPNNGGRFALIPIADAIAVAVDHEMVDLGELLRSSINGTTKRLADSSNTPASVLERLPMPVPVFFGKHRAS